MCVCVWVCVCIERKMADIASVGHSCRPVKEEQCTMYQLNVVCLCCTVSLLQNVAASCPVVNHISDYIFQRLWLLLRYSTTERERDRDMTPFIYVLVGVA